MIAVGATTMRYVTVIREMNVLFSGQVTVVSKDALVFQAIPISGSMLPQDSTMKKISTIQDVGNVTPVLFVTSASSQAAIQLVPVNFSMGIPLEDWELALGPLPLKGNGRLPTNDSSNEIVAGSSIADQFGWTVGTQIQIKGYNLSVTGILDTKMALLSRSFVMPLAVAQKVYTYPDSVNIIVVKPSQNATEQNLTDAIEQRVDNVNALTETQRNDIVQPVLEEVQTWSLGIEAVVFIISLILVMTVTIMSVSERRRDFATLDAIGAPTGYVFKAVITENFLIGVLGGAVGVFFGSITAIVLASLYTSIPVAMFFPSILEIVPPLYMLEMFGAIVGVCCVAGVIPAISAMRMRIIEVLRAEY